MSTASEAAPRNEAEWRRRRLRVGLLTAGVIVVTGVLLRLVRGSVEGVGLLPFVAVLVGLGVTVARRGSPVGPGIVRGGGLVLWLYVVVIGFALILGL